MNEQRELQNSMKCKIHVIRISKFIIGQDSNAQIGLVDDRCDEG